MKRSPKLDPDLIEVASLKAFSSADIGLNDNLTKEDVKLWISFNNELESFLQEFDCPKSYRIPSSLLDPFPFVVDLEYFETSVLNTQNIKLNISKSLTLNLKKGLRKNNSTNLLRKNNGQVKPSDKFEIRRANALLKKNYLKFRSLSSSKESEEESFSSLTKDIKIK